MTDPHEILLDAEGRMDGAVEAFRRDLNSVRTGRAHPSLIDTLAVDHYGQTQPLNQLGTINAPEARLLSVQVWDASAVQSVVKAIQTSDLGLNPNIDGQLIRLPIPQLTEERRQELVRVVHPEGRGCARSRAKRAAPFARRPQEGRTRGRPHPGRPSPVRGRTAEAYGFARRRR